MQNDTKGTLDTTTDTTMDVTERIKIEQIFDKSIEVLIRVFYNKNRCSRRQI